MSIHYSSQCLIVTAPMTLPFHSLFGRHLPSLRALVMGRDTAFTFETYGILSAVSLLTAQDRKSRHGGNLKAARSQTD
ncbi:MAG: hypothetical protein ICV84_23505 [Flavisolibacter sp.]|nr:hypothetical protein [Flavisolibacter sp.]